MSKQHGDGNLQKFYECFFCKLTQTLLQDVNKVLSENFTFFQIQFHGGHLKDTAKSWSGLSTRRLQHGISMLSFIRLRSIMQIGGLDLLIRAHHIYDGKQWISSFCSPGEEFSAPNKGVQLFSGGEWWKDCSGPSGKGSIVPIDWELRFLKSCFNSVITVTCGKHQTANEGRPSFDISKLASHSLPVPDHHCKE